MQKILDNARAERDYLIHQVADLGVEIGELKSQRAKILAESGLDGNSLEVMRLNEKLHNARRVLSVWNRQRENFDFLLSYLAEYDRRLDHGRE